MRQTANVQRVVAQQFAQQDWNRPDNQGYEPALLLAAVGRAAHSGGQTTLHLTPLHGKANILRPLIANIQAALRHVRAVAAQFKATDRWALMLHCIADKIAPVLGLFKPPTGLPATR